MAQKVITIILVLLVIGGLAWYFNKNYLQSSVNTTAEKLPQFKSSQGTDENFQGQLVYVTTSSDREIWASDTQKTQKKLFTDADETEKIIKISNLAPQTKEVLAITQASEESSFSGKLVAINLVTAKKTTLQENFGVPTDWALSADGQKIAFTRFSNLEEDYGYTLYSTDREGANLRQLAHSDSEIKVPCWSPNSNQIAYLDTSGTNSRLMLADTDTAKTTEIKSFSDKIIDWLSWSDKKLVFSLRGLDETSKGNIDIVDPSGQNLEKITDFSGGIANFAYLVNSAYLGFLVAQYPERIDDSTTGQIYILNPQGEKTPIGKGSQVLGWLLGG